MVIVDFIFEVLFIEGMKKLLKKEWKGLVLKHCKKNVGGIFLLSPLVLPSLRGVLFICLFFLLFFAYTVNFVSNPAMQKFGPHQKTHQESKTPSKARFLSNRFTLVLCFDCFLTFQCWTKYSSMMHCFCFCCSDGLSWEEVVIHAIRRRFIKNRMHEFKKRSWLLTCWNWAWMLAVSIWQMGFDVSDNIFWETLNPVTYTIKGVCLFTF